MKKLIIIYLLLNISSYNIKAQENNLLYFYSYLNKNYIKEDSNLVYLQINDSINTITDLLKNIDAEIYKLYTSKSAKIKLSEKVSMKDVKFILDEKSVKYKMYKVYKTKEGGELTLKNEIILAFYESVPLTSRDSLFKLYSLKIIKETSYYYVLSSPKEDEVIATANKIQESGLVKYSHPRFLAEAEKMGYIPNDEYFYWQWPLYNIGQIINDNHFGANDCDIDATDVWDVTRGDPDIIIAVLDEGVTNNHPDLPNARQIRLNGSNFAADFDGTNPNDPGPVGNGNHGNACAGTVAATQDNSLGISGIAPNCRIMPIRIPLGFAADPDYFADAIDFAWQNGADIISNSWGYQYYIDPNYFPEIVEAIERATTQGRIVSGTPLGSIVLFAVGNNAHHESTPDEPGWITFPSSTEVDFVVSVGASDRDDLQAIYSPTSDESSEDNQIIDICAPSHRAYPCQLSWETFEVWAIDIPGITGYNEWPYDPNNICMNPPPMHEQLPSTGIQPLSFTGRFGGTSHACPLVAGVAALMLSVNPNLTLGELYTGLMSSAEKVGGYSYVWSPEHDFIYWSEELGYGRVNANYAIHIAQGCGVVYFWGNYGGGSINSCIFSMRGMLGYPGVPASLELNYDEFVDLIGPFEIASGSELIMY